MLVTILGCGGAGGVPMVGFGWGDCDPLNLKNNRLRSSIYIETDNDEKILVDTSPDLRQQLLNNDIKKIDLVLYTHHHADHVHGIDELREINRITNAPLPVFGSKETLSEIKRKFNYAFESLEDEREKWGESRFWLSHTWLIANEFKIPSIIKTAKGTEIQTIDVDHGVMQVAGFRINDFAYITDEVDLSTESLNMLKGLKVLILGCITTRPHPTHAHLEKVLNWNEYLEPEKLYLTHMGPRLDYETLCQTLPKNIFPAFDGLKLDI